MSFSHAILWNCIKLKYDMILEVIRVSRAWESHESKTVNFHPNTLVTHRNTENLWPGPPGAILAWAVEEQQQPPTRQPNNKAKRNQTNKQTNKQSKTKPNKQTNKNSKQIATCQMSPRCLDYLTGSGSRIQTSDCPGMAIQIKNTINEFQWYNRLISVGKNWAHYLL